MIEPNYLEIHHYLYLFIVLPLTEIKAGSWEELQDHSHFKPSIFQGCNFRVNLGSILIYFPLSKRNLRKGRQRKQLKAFIIRQLIFRG